MKYLILLLSVFFFITGCRKQIQSEQMVPYSTTEDTEIADMFHNAENSLDYWGTYEGSLPTAEGNPAHVELILNKNKTFIKCTEYRDREPLVIHNDSGVYVVDRNLLVLHPETKEEYYKVEENRLRKLTEEKQEIEGKEQDNYLLMKKE